MIPVLIIAFVFVIIMAPPRCFGQLMSVETSAVMLADSMRRELKTAPYFSLYKDNYFIVGTSLAETPTKHNSDAKFQISLAFRLTKSTLPWDTYLSLTYTQVAFWNVFEDSFPMRDINFNPGIAWTKPYYHGNRYIGSTSLIVEHESNGRDGDTSRSWNRISLSGNLYVTDRVRIFGKIWIPIVDGENNRNLAEYVRLAVIDVSRNPAGAYVVTLRTGVQPALPDIESGHHLLAGVVFHRTVARFLCLSFRRIGIDLCCPYDRQHTFIRTCRQHALYVGSAYEGHAAAKTRCLEPSLPDKFINVLPGAAHQHGCL